MLDHLGIIPLCNQGRSEVVAIYPGIPRNSQEFPEIPRNTGTLFSDNPKISKVDSHKLLGTLVPQSSVWNKPSTELPSRLPSDSRAKHQCHLSGHKWPSGCERLKRHEATPGGRWGPGHHVQKFGSRQHSPGEKTDLAAKNVAKNKKNSKKATYMRKREVVKREEFVDAGNVKPINHPIHRARPTTWGYFKSCHYQGYTQ